MYTIYREAFLGKGPSVKLDLSIAKQQQFSLVAHDNLRSEFKHKSTQNNRKSSAPKDTISVVVQVVVIDNCRQNVSLLVCKIRN